MYLARMDTGKLARAEQAAAFPGSVGNFWPDGARVQVARLLAGLRQEAQDAMSISKLPSRTRPASAEEDR